MDKDKLGKRPDRRRQGPTTRRITLLHLRDIATKHGPLFSLVNEMLDMRNRAAAQVARPDDLILSPRLTSLLLAQIASTAT